MLGDILVKEVFKGSHITLLDINSDALKKVFDYAKKFIEDNKLDFTYRCDTK